MTLLLESFNWNVSIQEKKISTQSPIPTVNVAQKYDDIGLHDSFVRIITTRTSLGHCIAKKS